MNDAERLLHLNRIHYVLFKIGAIKGIGVNEMTEPKTIDDSIAKSLKLAAKIAPNFGIQAPTDTWIKELIRDQQD